MYGSLSNVTVYLSWVLWSDFPLQLRLPYCKGLVHDLTWYWRLCNTHNSHDDHPLHYQPIDETKEHPQRTYLWQVCWLKHKLFLPSNQTLYILCHWECTGSIKIKITKIHILLQKKFLTLIGILLNSTLTHPVRIRARNCDWYGRQCD